MPDDTSEDAKRRAAAASAYGVSYATDSTISDDADDATDAQDRDRRFPGVLALILLILAAILILMLRSCGDLSEGTGASSKAIVPVPGRHPVPGAVSVWVAPGTDVKAVFSRAGVQVTGFTALGEGRWVVNIREGSEKQAVNALRHNSKVYDAGLVYEDPTPLEGEAAPASTP